MFILNNSTINIKRMAKGLTHHTTAYAENYNFLFAEPHGGWVILNSYNFIAHFAY